MSVLSRPRVLLVNRCFVRHDGKNLLIRRSSKDTYNAGRWEVPGGKLDHGQDLARAQEREVMEETGLLVRPIHPLVAVDSFLIGEGKYKGLPYVVLFSITEVVGGHLKVSHEHSTYVWEGYEKMLEYELTDEVRKAAIVLKDHLQ